MLLTAGYGEAWTYGMAFMLACRMTAQLVQLLNSVLSLAMSYVQEGQDCMRYILGYALLLVVELLTPVTLPGRQV